MSQATTNQTEPVSVREFFGAVAEHLTELRTRVIKAVLTWILATALSFIFVQPLMEFLCIPIGGISVLRSIEVTENVTSAFRITMMSGFILGSPIILYQILAFILPALKNTEKKTLFTFLPIALALFLCGAAFTFFIILPVAIPFLINFLSIDTQLRPANYFGFISSLILWIGLAFETPLIIFILARFGFITATALLKNWRIAVVISAVVAMIITPTIDPFNMMIVMLPLIALYFLGVLFASFAKR